MSTSEFEEQSSEKEKELFPLSLPERGLPDDFSAEDMSFAQELGNLFSAQDEEVPPYFAQTLLEPEHPRCQAIEQGFEQKTCAHVFRRLKLHRRLFRPPHSSMRFFTTIFPPRRSFTALFAASILFMLLTMIATSNSFAAGMAVLWSGAHSGALQMQSYPQVLATPIPHKQPAYENVPKLQKVTLVSILQDISFSMYWPSHLPDNYRLDTIAVLNGPDQSWADGSVVELNYNYLLPGVKPHGTGRIAIREFKPMGKVLQVVPIGAVHQTQVGDGDHGQGLYVDGQWGQTTNVSHAWMFGTRSELIYERNGIVFWIVGDQRDGISNVVLQNVVSSMNALELTRAVHMDNSVMDSSGEVTLSPEASSWLFAGDVIYEDGPDGPSFTVIGPTAKNHSGVIVDP